MGYNVLDGSFYVFRAKKVVFALGNVANRAWTNSTGNPFNVWYPPYNTGGQFVMAYNAGVKLVNLDISQIATIIPKGYGAPGMNGINSMGGRQLNALGERFMSKYAPMLENGLRINQISGTYQELIEGKLPGRQKELKDGTRTAKNATPICWAASLTAARCQTVCPFTKYDEAVMHDLVKMSIAKVPVLNRFIRKMDDIFGYGSEPDLAKTPWDLNSMDIPLFGLDSSRS